MGKQARSLAAEEALRRTLQITPLLASDTWYALRARVALHTANDTIVKGKFDGPRRFGDTYNVVQNSLALTVAMAVARLFDVTNPDRYPVEGQDKASIPVLANLLMRTDVQDALAARARQWLPDGGAGLCESDCRTAVLGATSLYDAYLKSSDHQEALSRLRKFRTSRLAHHLFDGLPTDLPRFDDLDLLADYARNFVRLAVLAVEGIDRDLADAEKIKCKVDRQFWDIGLSAALAAEE